MESPLVPPFTVPYTIKHYILTDVIGKGAFAVVYKARNESNGETVAIKVIKKTLLPDNRSKTHLQRELDTTAYLRHENIVALHDFFTDNEHFFMVMDYCPGGSLMDVMCGEHNYRDSHIASVFKQIVTAVNFCHAHDVAHRDLKLENILVTTFPSVKIADFGLCGYSQRDGKMQTFCGSPCYTAPECLNGTRYDGKLADIWSLGVILYELVVREHPWPVHNTSKMVQLIQKGQYTIPVSITPALADLIKSMMRLNPRDRPSCDVILAHPWLKIAGSRCRTEPSLPPLNPASPLSMSQFTSSLDRKNETSDHGIYNPFAGAPPAPQLVGPPMPRPQRSRSGCVAQKLQARRSQLVLSKRESASCRASLRALPIPMPSRKP